MNLQWKNSAFLLFLSSADEMCASLSQLTYTAKKKKSVNIPDSESNQIVIKILHRNKLNYPHISFELLFTCM